MNSKRRSVLCDTTLGTTLCEFRSTHEEVDVTSCRSSRDGAMLHAPTIAGRYWLHEHPRGHASWRELTMRKITKRIDHVLSARLVSRWNIQKMASESNEYVRNTNSWRLRSALESYFDEHGKEVCERNWMSPEVQTALLNTYPPKLIATILKVCIINS